MEFRRSLAGSIKKIALCQGSWYGKTRSQDLPRPYAALQGVRKQSVILFMTCHKTSEMPLETTEISIHLGRRGNNRRAWLCPAVEGMTLPRVIFLQHERFPRWFVVVSVLHSFREEQNLSHDSDPSSFFSSFAVSSTQILHSVSLLKQLYFLPPFLHLHFFLMSNSDSKLFLSFIPISDSIQSPAHVLIFLAVLYSVNAFVSLAREQKISASKLISLPNCLGEQCWEQGGKVLCQVLEEQERHLFPPDIPPFIIIGKSLLVSPFLGDQKHLEEIFNSGG